jgi:hypothetical protein
LLDLASADSFLLPQLRRRSLPGEPHRHRAMAATNKCLAQSNKSRTVPEATKKRTRTKGIHRASMAMTLQEAKSIAKHLGLTLRKVRSGDYRVNFRDGNEMTPYYTDNLEDAVSAAVEKARKRGQSPC